MKWLCQRLVSGDSRWAALAFSIPTSSQDFITGTAMNDGMRIIRIHSRRRSDMAAVRAALGLPWSNGQTGGHVHRLKALKRQKYDRANFDCCEFADSAQLKAGFAPR